jgi:hypothetical protein
MAKKKIFHLIPTFGIVSFMMLYIIAASQYSGGSKWDKQTIGFNWLKNYWCDLFDVVAYNGQQNPARPIAIFAMFVLSCSFGLLWCFVSKYLAMNNLKRKVMNVASILSMLISVFLFTSFHEEVINFGGLFGGIALTLTFIALRKNQENRLFYLGIVCLLLSCINYFIYQTGIALQYLALTQKITFLIFFIWGILLNFALLKHIERT